MNKLHFLLTDPEIQDGAPVFVGTHVRYETFCDYMRIGVPLHEFLSEFPSITKDQALLALQICKQGMPIEIVATMATPSHELRSWFAR